MGSTQSGGPRPSVRAALGAVGVQVRVLAVDMRHLAGKGWKLLGRARLQRSREARTWQ